MELRLEKFIERMVGIADVRNLSPNNPITIKITAPNSNDEVIIVVAVNEPWNYPLPFNVTWINFNPQDAFFKRAMKRTAKTKQSPTSPYEHSWQILNLYDAVFNPPQYFDSPPTDVDALLALFNAHINNGDNPHDVNSEQTNSLNLGGGVMQGPVYARTLGQNENFQNNEFITKNYADSTLAPLVLGLETIILEVSELKAAKISSHIHSQETAAVVWNVTHGLNNENYILYIVASDGEIVWPASVVKSDSNTAQINFVVPEEGKAYLLALPS